MNNSSTQKFIKNLKHVIFSQVLVLFLGVIRSIYIPIILTVKDFGYWQVYLFYASYLGIFSLGYNDGIYLKYGGYDYEKLPKEKMSSSFYIHIIILFCFTIISFTVSLFLKNINTRNVFLFISLNILIFGINGVLTYIFQITNQMKKYSFFSILPNFLLIVGIFFFNSTNYLILIMIDFIVRLFSIVIMLYMCKDIFKLRIVNLKLGIIEYKANITIGFKLMIAQLIGMLLIGIGRIIIELLGTIEEYAYYSFGLTITNMILLIVSAVAIVIYPTLKRINQEQYYLYYKKLNKLLSYFVYLIPIPYFISIFIIQKYLPKYLLTLNFLNILFCLIVVQSKNQLLVTNFFKVLRKEKELMKINIAVFMIGILLCFISYYLKRKVEIVAYLTLLIILIRCYYSEYRLGREIEAISNYQILKEIIIILIYLTLSKFLNIRMMIIIYLIFIIIYILKNKQELEQTLNNIDIKS